MAKLGVEIIGDAASLKAALGEAAAATDKFAADYKTAFAAMSDSTLKLAVAQDKLAIATARYGSGTTGAAAATLAYRRQVEGVAASHLAAARTIGRGISSYVTAPTALLGYEAIKMAFNFGQAMELIRTQAGASQAELRHMSDGVLRLTKDGQSYGRSATDMAKGLFFVESEGIRGARALEILRVAAAGAAVGQTDLAETANALTSAMRVYKLPADQAAQAMATLNAAVGVGKMHMEDLNAALGTKFLPVARQLGVSLPQAGAALAVFTQAGIPAQVAANNLATAFIKFEAPTKAGAKALSQLGLSSTQLASELQSGGLPAALGTLARAYEQMVTSQGKVAANQAIFTAFGGIRGGSSVLTLVQQYSAYMADLRRVQEQNSPATFWTSVAAEMHQPAEQVKEDMAKISADLIKLGQLFAPIAADMAGAAAKIAAAFNNLPGPIKTDIGVIVAVLAAGGPLILAAAGVVRAVNAIRTAFAALPVTAGPAAAETEAELAGIGGAADAAGVHVGALGGKLAALPVTAGPAAAETEAELAGIGGAADAAGVQVGALGGKLAALVAGGPYVIPLVLALQFPDQARHVLAWIDKHVVGGIPGLGGLGDWLAGQFTPPFQIKGERNGRWPNATPAQIRGLREAEHPLEVLSRQAREHLRQQAQRRSARSEPLPLDVVIAQDELAAARGDRGARDRLIADLHAKIRADERQAEELRRNLQRGVGDRKSEAQQLKTLLGDEKAAYDEITSLTSGRLSGHQRVRTGIPEWKREWERQLKELEIRFDRAKLTKGLKDDMAAVQAILDATQAQLRLHKGDLDLQRELVRAQQQMTELRQKETDALRKQSEATQKAISDTRSAFGTLFQGPVLAPTPEQQKLLLGVPPPAPQALYQDLQGQLKLFTQFESDLSALRRRGAPKQLLAEIRQQGLAALPELESLVRAPKQLLDRYFALFSRAQREIVHTARMEVQADQVTIVARAAQPDQAARLGRQPGPHDTGEHIKQALRGMPHHARGAIVRSPALALIAEAGPEAVLPLDRGGAPIGDVHIHVHAQDPRTAALEIERVLQRLSRYGSSSIRGRYGGRNRGLS